MVRPPKPPWWIKLGRILFGQQYKRLSGLSPDQCYPCHVCGRVKYTEISEIWSEADPMGHMERLCADCGYGYGAS